jgi:hypothetical protein
VYHVDKFGAWDQATTFKYQESLFVVEFTAYEGDEASWATDMDALYSTINSEMEFLRSVSDLPLKILHLISWRKTISASKAGSILVWFDADPAYIFDIPGSQLDSNMGQTGDGCAENDAWSMKEGILTLSFEDVWVYGTYNSEGQANISSTWSCSNFDITKNGYNLEVLAPLCCI